jgi:uncharacterized membrane protein YgcG
MQNPVELISRSRRRLARIAALKTVLYLLFPVAAAFALAGAFGWIGHATWEKAGYMLSPAHAAMIREALFAIGAAGILLMAALALRAYRRANDFVATAAKIDEIIGAHQEVVTLAALAAPGDERKTERSPLFPMLWRRVVSYFDIFDPKRAFRPQVARPFAGSSLLMLALVIALGLATVALMRPPTPEQALARHLRQIARQLEASANPAERAFAGDALKAADMLENPRLPPREKVAELQQIERQLDQMQAHSQQLSQSGSGKGNSGGQGGGKSSGSGNGNAGSGTGTGHGSGAGTGAGATQNNGKNKGDQLAELHNDIAKAQAQIQTESGPRDETKGDSSGHQKGNTLAAKAGDNPNRNGPQNNPNGKGMSLPHPDNNAPNRSTAANHSSGNKNDQGMTGDTHLGEFPKAESFQRYIKPGDKGPPIAIHDARYVLFRLPPAVPTSNGTGALVPDTERPTATTPYTNAPLKRQHLAATPDERQLVPPRYRDLIR